MQYLLITFSILLALSTFEVATNNLTKKSLLVGQCKQGEKVCYTSQLFQYDFVNGKLVNKKLIIESEDVSFREGEYKFIDKRYLITYDGNIIDIQKKKLLYKGEGHLHSINRRNILTKVVNKNKGNRRGIYQFNLDSGEYSLFLKTTNSMLLSNLSPNGLKRAEQVCYDYKCGIEIEELGKKDFFIKGKFEVTLEQDFDWFHSDGIRTPVLWIDNERLLTQKNNGELVFVYTNGKVSPFLSIKLDKVPSYNPKLHRTIDGNIYYVCGDKFLIDIENKSYKNLTNDLFYEFAFKRETNTHWKTYFYNGKKLGNKIWSDSPITTKGHIAIQYAESGENLAYPKGVKVWNIYTKKWKDIEISWNAIIIGWLE